MRIMLLGAGGFIGRYLLAELAEHGHEVVAVVRRRGTAAAAADAARVVVLDTTAQHDPTAWAPHLAGVELIVNAAGVLRGRRLQGAHVDMPRALYAAARRAGVRRVVLLSAISARPDVPTAYARTKLDGEAVLRDSGLHWTILRPSLVYGDGSYGGTSLVRGLAALPGLVPLAGDGRYGFTPIHARDLARAVRIVSEDDRFAGATLDPVGPETLDLRALLARYRRWLGLAPARFLPVPLPAMRLLGRLGDLFGDGPVSSTSLAQLVAGNEGDSAAFEAAIGFRPRTLDAALSGTPAEVQDRWHARLFFLAPLLRWVLVLLWLASGLLGLATGAPATAALVGALGLPIGLAAPLRIGSSLLDLGIAAALVAGRRPGAVAAVQLAVVAGYTAVIGWGLPGLWLDPFGALVKNLPIAALILVQAAIAEKR